MSQNCLGLVSVHCNAKVNCVFELSKKRKEKKTKKKNKIKQEKRKKREKRISKETRKEYQKRKSERKVRRMEGVIRQLVVVVGIV